MLSFSLSNVIQLARDTLAVENIGAGQNNIAMLFCPAPAPDGHQLVAIGSVQSALWNSHICDKYVVGSSRTSKSFHH